MKHLTLPILVLLAAASMCAAQESEPAPVQSEPTQVPAAQTEAAPVRTEFHVRYISGTNVYIDGGRSAGLIDGMELVLKQDPTQASSPALEPGVVARLKVVSVASTSAVCEIEAKARDLAENDVVTLPQEEVAKIVAKDALGNTRKYPMVVSFSEGDPLDEEVREAEPRPPLPEVNQLRGRIGFDISNVQELGQASSTSSSYGAVFRADFTRIAGTHWNLNGYWRGSIQRSSTPSQPSLQDLINRTYLMSLSYINPNSHWSAQIGRFYVPFAASLETIDGFYTGYALRPKTILGTFGGSTPDPTGWSYNPNRRIGGGFFNIHGGNYENFHYSTTTGAGVEMLHWSVNRPFVFTENDFSFKRYFSVFHSMQLDKPTANPTMPTVNAGLGQSLLSVRAQVHPRVTLDLTHTYFRDVPTYDANLVGTGLLDKYLYQGLNGGARVQFPLHVTGYLSLGKSSDSNDKKDSLNKLFGATMSNIWKTGLQIDARYSQFDSAFASGTYRSAMISRDLGERFRVNVQGGRYKYSSSLAANDNSNFVNAIFDSNLGSRLFVESMFSTQRGGSLNYNQWINTIGFRFDNRASRRRAAEAAAATGPLVGAAAAAGPVRSPATAPVVGTVTPVADAPGTPQQ